MSSIPSVDEYLKRIAEFDMFKDMTPAEREEKIKNTQMILDWTGQFTNYAERLHAVAKNFKKKAVIWSAGFLVFACLLSFIPFDRGYIYLVIVMGFFMGLFKFIN